MRDKSTASAILLVVLFITLFPGNVGEIAARMVKGYQAEMAGEE
ncbi:hypothetical protein [Sagittula sp. MA-2]|mgnify:CR=1 FL=1|jgi:hypothetical protein|nr:hypothetical protein [Sagittula sp. MA-2]WHZ35745.1 hypothetical protein QNI11_01775 [Sagittula sp. MA-2]